ncbi:MAG: hypothetical protein K2W82_14460 [Candidatus Obscuribacterales bacterium]|nr:hypothetical protein [Candidatus Obscuribacterales bacterium]
MSVLILAETDDEHCKAVCKHLQAKAVPYKIWHKSSVLNSAAITAKISSKNFSFKANGEEEELDFTGFQSIWFRRPGQIKVAQPFPAVWMDRMVERESERGFNALIRSLDCFMVNHPARQEECLYKPFQLTIAASCGLSIPATLISNSAQEASRFIAAQDNSCIYKLIDEKSIWEAPALERSGIIPTLLVREADKKHLDQVSRSLHLFQERIDKTCDVRVTIVGKQLFAAEIDSQSGIGHTDFRLDPKAAVRKHELDKEISERCLAFMEKIGLQFACIDLALTKTGNYVFFEANPAGQFLWIEEATGLPIAKELASLLAKGSGR